MVFHGRVIGGTVVIDPPGVLPEGAEVQVQVLVAPAQPTESEIPTLYERFKDFVGKATDLPPDMAEQHDHYIHGTPKR
jgi:hypothetical protein